jgi:hypothetical protein
MTLLKGTDVSVWQDLNSTSQMYDPIKTRKMGGYFVGIKVSQSNWADPDFVMNWANCKKILYRMPYHFLVWNADPKIQAEKFWSLIENDLVDVLPLICDFEWWQTTPSNAMDIVYNFLERMKQLSSPLPLGIYTAKSFWDVYGSKNDYWKQYKLWLCDIEGSVPIPLPWTRWDFHQYTFSLNGPAWGAESLDLDGDYYNGTLEQMMLEYSLSPLEDVIAPPVVGQPLFMRVIKNVNIRSGPSTSYADVGDYYVGDIVGPVLNVAGGKSGAWVQVGDSRWVCVSDIYQNNYLVKVG